MTTWLIHCLPPLPFSKFLDPPLHGGDNYRRENGITATQLLHRDVPCSIGRLLFSTLRDVQLVVDSVIGHELRMGSLFSHLSIVDHNDFVRVLNSRQSMSNDKTRTTDLRLVQRFLHHLPVTKHIINYIGLQKTVDIAVSSLCSCELNE